MVGKEAFQSQMCKIFEVAISGDKWDEEKLKFWLFQLDGGQADCRVVLLHVSF
jgi:hypothetical protein